VVEATSEIIELYNPADIFSWIKEAARDPAGHLIAADELEHDEAVEPPSEQADEGEDWQRGLPAEQQETIAAQRLWQLADAYRSQIATQQSQALREFTANAEEVLSRTGDLVLVDENDDTLILRSDGRFETSLDLTDLPAGSARADHPRRAGLTVTDAKVVADFYDPADVLAWVTDALNERYPHVDFSAVYE
jgi:hypothetical protein